MIKRIEGKLEKLGDMFVTENAIYNELDMDRIPAGSKYFLYYFNTYKLAGAFSTQRDLEERLDDILAQRGL